MSDSDNRPTDENQPIDNAELAERIVQALKGIYDPEIPVSIYDLGLIYDVIISDHQEVYVEMTLTTPGCPVAQTFPGQIEYTLRSVPGVAEARVEVVWDPPWTKDRMSEEALLTLGLF